jgi:hypothetical protein
MLRSTDMTTPSKPLPSPFRFLAMALPLICLFGCAGTSPTPPATVYPDVTGNWQFQIETPVTTPPTLPTNPIANLFGSLSSSGGKVTGILNARTFIIGGSGGCVALNADLAATGTIDQAGNLTLTAPISGGIATISVAAATTAGFLNGTYQVVGGPCAQPSIGLSAYEVPNVTGTYTGTFSQVVLVPGGSTVGSVSLTATLVQATAPNADGQYPLSGTITATGGCSDTISFNQGVVFGAGFQNFPNLGTFPLSGTFFLGNIPPDTGHISMLTTFEDVSSCGSATFNGVLTRQ